MNESALDSHAKMDEENLKNKNKLKKIIITNK